MSEHIPQTAFTSTYFPQLLASKQSFRSYLAAETHCRWFVSLLICAYMVVNRPLTNNHLSIKVNTNQYLLCDLDPAGQCPLL